VVQNDSLIERDPGRRKIAKLLRRATLQVNSYLINEYSKISYSDAVKKLMEAEEGTISPLDTDDIGEVVGWWIQQMGGSTSGLHEKMTWFWHSLLTTHRNDANGTFFVRKQLELLRTHALGNYRELLHEFVKDGALLAYLDGDGSQASNPNENLSRELMELFTLGVGNYSEDDVRSAARAMAGWQVDREENEVNFNNRRAFKAPLIFRGVQDSWDTEKIVDHLCDDKQTAAYVSRQIWFYLGGGWLNEKDSKDLGDWWHGKDLEIKPLVEKALLEMENSPDYQRPRTGIDFYFAYASVTNFDITESNYRLRQLDQMPYEPPNVAGWAKDDRWLLSGSMLVRGQLAFQIDFENINNWESIDSDSALNLCGIYAVSKQTLNALKLVDNSDLTDEDKAKARLMTALASPEFQLL